MAKNQMFKPYFINAMDGGRKVEVNLYGEVVESVPTDWWTGEKIDGLFIEEAAFLDELDNYKMADEITFRINSIGGDVNAGKAIFNRIRSLEGHTVTIVDGIAASAASIIAQAGDERKMMTGSQMMIHGASTLMVGYFNAKDIKGILNALENTNGSIADIYADTTGTDRDEALRMMTRETWMTADEAVEKGFADEVVTGKEPEVDMVEDDETALVVNGVFHKFAAKANLPQMAITGMYSRAQLNKIVNGGKPSTIEPVNAENEKEVSIMDLHELKEAYPELVNQIAEEATAAACTSTDDAVKEALEADRARMKEIDSIAAQIGDPELINKAKYEEPMSAADLALEAMKAQARVGAEYMAARAEDTQDANSIAGDPNPGMEDTVAQDEAQLNAIIDSLKKEVQ